MPPLMITSISMPAKINVINIARERVIIVEKLRNAGFTIPIKVQRISIV
jgi:hypothetical protein